MSTPQPQDKADVQISLLKAALLKEGIEVEDARRPDGSLDYLYEVGVILVRHGYLGEVRSVLSERRGEPGGEEGAGQREGKRRPDPGFIPGVTILSLAPYNLTVPVALDLIDREIGEGVATPNHILSITPAYCCPATEPVVVPADSQPDPGVCEGGGGGVFIYVPDTGFIEAAERHPWLAGVTGDPDAAVGPGVIREYGGHGTFVAGVARCMAPLAAVFVTDDFTRGGAISEHEIVLRLNQGLSLGADIISLSAGGATRKDLPLLGFEAFWNRYRHYKNLVVVAAAGNNSSRRPFWPAAFPEVVSVGALSADRRARAYFSDFGPWVDVYAPGENLVNAYATGVYECREPPYIGQRRHFHGMASWSGTSFATPLVSGLIAARRSRTGESARQAAEALLALARANRIPGVGPVLLPCDTGDVDTDRACCGCCCGAR